MASVLVLAFMRGALADDITVSGKNTSVYNYAGHVTFTVQGCAEGTVKDFPLYVRVSEAAIPGFSYDMIREEPKTNDLVFLDSTGLSLDYEIEKWDVRGESDFWVKVPTLNNGTTVTMCWNLRDGCTKPARNNPKAVWADYTGVWHMDETITATAAPTTLSADATGHGLDIEPVANTNKNGNLSRMVSTSGVFGNARINDVNNGKTGENAKGGNGLSIPYVEGEHALPTNGVFTLPFWVKQTGALNYPQFASWRKNDSKGFMVDQNNSDRTKVLARGEGNNPGEAYVKVVDRPFTEAYAHLAFVYSNKTVNVYGNGACKAGDVAINSAGSTTLYGRPIMLGNNGTLTEQSLWGMYDEIRLFKGLKSAVWIAAEYAQGAPGFYAAGAVTNDTAAVLKNTWESPPSISQTTWEIGTRPTSEDFHIRPRHGLRDDVAVVIYDRATGEEIGRGTGWDFDDIIPSAPGSYRVELSLPAQDGWGALDYTLGFRIAANGGSHAFNDNVARILLANDDYTVEGGEVEWQGYDDEDRYDGLPYWQHLDADGNDASTTYCEYWSDSYDFNLGGGTHHIYRQGGAIDRLWDLRDIRIGNTFNNGEILEERSGRVEVDDEGLAPDQNYLPWNRDSQRVLGHVTGEPVEGYHRYAGHVVMQNTTNAAVTSTCYTNGIGTIYFDAVNGFTHNVTNGVGEANYRLVVEIATNKVGTALPPTERWVSFNACEDITVGLADAAREPFFGADWVQWKGLRVLRFDGGQCTDLGTADAVDLKIEEGGGYGRFYRVIVPVNLTPATGGIRFRIRRVAIDRTQSHYPDGSAYILLDNVICSTPTPCVQLQPYGRFFQQTQPGDVAQGWEGAFVPAFPSVADTNVYGRTKASMSDGSPIPAGIVASATMHYRWHYIEQQTTEWREADLDPVTLVARDSLALPAYQGDIDFWFDAVQHGHYYTYADYSGTGLKLGDSGYTEEIPAVTNGVGKGWFVRTREGRSGYAEMQLLVKTSEKSAVAELPLSVVKDGLWRGYYRMTNGVDGIWWRIEARNEQTAGATDWNWSTNRWYVADWTEEPPTFPAAGRMSEGTTNSWSRMTCDRQTGYLMFQVDETTLGVTAIHADYQNFNRWSGADKGYFVGASSDTNSTSMAGTSPDVREYSMSYASWADTPSVNTNWNLSFNNHTIGESKLFEGYKTFANFNDYFSAWQIGKGMWVYGKYLDPASHVALQMAGNGEGYAEFSNRTILEDDWPRGLESVSFHSRLAQVVSPELMAYNMVGVMQENERYVNITPTMLLTNYTFMARTCFDMQKNQGFSGNASVSLFAYYKPGTGAYEARWEQIAGYLPPAGGDYDGKTLGPKPQGQRLVISRWDASATGEALQETVLYAVTNSASFGVDMPTMPCADGVTATNNLMPFLISVYKQGNDTIVLAGIRRAPTDKEEGQYGGVSWNTDVDRMLGSWYIACVRDKSSKQLTGGAYGVLSANCEGMFLTPQWRDGMTYPSDVLPSALGTKAYSNKTLNSVTGYADSYNEMKLGWWGMNRGRTKMLYDAHSGKSQPFGFAYVPVSQTIKVLAKPLDSKDEGWTNAKLLGQVTVSDFGHPFTEPDHKPTFYYTTDSKLRLQTGGDLDDFRRDVVINDIEIRQWRGYQSSTEKDRYNYHTNFVFTSGWITNGAAQLSAKRTAVGTPCAIRSPLFDGDYGNGNGIGDFSFTYREPQKNIRLLVQIATNVTGGSDMLQSLTDSIQTDGDGNQSWHTVTNLTYADLWPSAPEKGDTRTWTQPFSYHGAKGLVRVLVDPKLVEEVSPIDCTNTAAFGAIDVTGVLCFDEPSLAKGCWWGWNLQTIGKGYTETKDEQKRMYLPDYAGNERNGRSLALNNSVTDDIDPDAKDPNAFRKHMPFLQSPIFTNIIGQISFKARKFENSDYAPAAQVVVYGAADSPVSLEDKDWTYIAAFPITNTIYTTYTCKTDSRNFYALRLAVVDVPGTPERPEDPKWTTSPQRVLLDEVSVSEAVRAVLAFRNVGAFRSNLDDNSIVTGVTTRVQQPLCDENWGVQAEVYATMLGDEIDKNYPPRVKLHWYVGKEPWGFSNWRKRETGSAYLAQADGSNYVFRSSYKTCPGAVMPATTEPGTVVQYMLEVEYRTINTTQGEPTYPMATNWLDAASWTVPEWYAPVDYNADPEYGAGRTFAAFNILDTVAPGWAWLNEANVFGTTLESGANSDEQFQYVEVCAPMEADLSGWQLRFLEAGVYNNKVVTNEIATFGSGRWDQAAGKKKDNLGAKYNMVFRCLGNKESAQLSKDNGTLDGLWEFSVYTDMFRNRGGVDCVYDMEMPFGVQLVRPTGIIESSIVIVGTNRWGRLGGYPDYDPTNIVAMLNKNVPGSKFYYAAEDCCGTFRSASVTEGRAESAGVWTNDWACSPGYINTNWGGKVEQKIDPLHPTPHGDSIIVYATLDLSGGPIRQWVGGKGSAQTNATEMVILKKGSDCGTNIVYQVDPWYEIAPVTTNGAVFWYEPRVREKALTVGKGASNNLTVVARAQADSDLRDKYGLTEDNPFTPAVLDWLHGGSTKYGPFAHEDGIGLADYWDMSNTCVTNLSLTQMYCLDMDPTVSNLIFKAGMMDAWPVIDHTQHTTNVVPGYVGNDMQTNVRMQVFMMISNKAEAVKGPDGFRRAWAPYILRGLDPNFTSWDYRGGGSIAQEWESETFKVTGILANGRTRERNEEDWKPLRWFVFHEGSFAADYTTHIEIVDPHDPSSQGQAYWYDWFHDKDHPERAFTPVFNRWAIDMRSKPVEVEILQPTNFFSSAASP